VPDHLPCVSLIATERRCHNQTCDPDPQLCGEPWKYPPTVLYSSVRISGLARNIRSRARRNNMVPSYISPYVKENETHFAIIYKEVDNVKDYKIVFDIDTATAVATVKEMAADNFYAVCATSYYVGDTLYHIIVFSKMISGGNVQVFFDQTGGTYTRNNASANADGLSLACRTVIINARGRRRYTTLYRRNKDGVQTVEYDDLGFRGLIRTVRQQKQNGFQLAHVSSITVKSRTRYSAIFTNEKIGDCEFCFLHTYNERDIDDIAKNHREGNFRMTAVAMHSPSSFPLFMGVFKK